MAAGDEVSVTVCCCAKAGCAPGSTQASDISTATAARRLLDGGSLVIDFWRIQRPAAHDTAPAAIAGRRRPAATVHSSLDRCLTLPLQGKPNLSRLGGGSAPPACDCAMARIDF